jgi:DNA polymerase-3 subunit delta'
MNEVPLPWQREQWAFLLERFQQERLPHALLLTGIAGLGKTAFARSFAQLLLCAKKTACGGCRACYLFLAGNHPDFYYLAPESVGKNIRIDVIRELTADLQQTAQQGGYKVAILAPAEAMAVGAANALLKTLEEPTATTVIFLVSDAATRIPATLRSRCQRVVFYPPTVAVAEQWLLEKGILQNSQLLLKLSEGAPLRAYTLGTTHTEQTLRRQLLISVKKLSLQQLAPLDIAAQCAKSSINDILPCLLSVLLDAIRLKLQPDTLTIANSDALIDLQVIASALSQHAIFSLVDKLYELRRQSLISNPNPQLSWEAIFCSWWQYVGEKLSS